MIIHLTFHITLPPVLQDRQRPAGSVNDTLLDVLKPRARPGCDHQASCQICQAWTQFYSSPAKARQGLAGHQSWCKRKRDGKTSHKASIPA